MKKTITDWVERINRSKEAQRAYMHVRSDMLTLRLLLELMKDKETWEVRACDLLDDLQCFEISEDMRQEHLKRYHSRLPSSALGMRCALNRLEPVLETLNVFIVRRNSNGRKLIEITKLDDTKLTKPEAVSETKEGDEHASV